MGGYGSGRSHHYGGKETTDDYIQLNISYLKKHKMLKPGYGGSLEWSRRGTVFSSIRYETADNVMTVIYRHRNRDAEWQDMRLPVRLERTACQFGGERTWFLCPATGCGRRVAILYGGKIFACRHCYQLAYPVQREKDTDRHARRADKIRDRLGWEPGILNGEGCKPKGMHWQTFERLYDDHARYSETSLRLMGAWFDKSNEWITKRRPKR